MTLSTVTLPRRIASPIGKPIPPLVVAQDMQEFAKGLANGHRLWTSDTARSFTELFDELAATWDTTQATGRDDPVRDALARGGPFLRGPCLELGSGTGQYTPLLAAAFPGVISLDLSARMLRQAAGRSPVRVRADAAALPLADASMVAVAAIDMLLFPLEIARVLMPGGALLWINQLGADGPLYLPAAEVAAALPGQWQAVEADAGWGSWAVLHRRSELTE